LVGSSTLPPGRFYCRVLNADCGFDRRWMLELSPNLIRILTPNPSTPPGAFLLS